MRRLTKGLTGVVWFMSVCAVPAACDGGQRVPTAPAAPTPVETRSPPGAPPLPSGDWHVARGGAGDGTEASPFGRVQDALDMAAAGDTILVSSGTYPEALVTRRPNVRVVGVGDVTVTASGRVVDVQHPQTFENLRFDGKFGDRDTVRVRADDARFRAVEVLNSGRDGIDVSDVSGLVVEGSHIHHCIWRGRDAHGIVGGRLTGAVVRDTRIHDVTGDGIQLDAGRASGGWDIRVENVDISDAGEDGIDTKTGGRGRLTVVGGSYRGFRGQPNSAAFNIKESVEARISGVTVSDANIGFRLRHPADVRLSSSSIADSDRGIRYEDGIAEHPLISVTFENVRQEIQRVN